MSDKDDGKKKENEKWILIIILILVGWFLWFQVRPMCLKRKCHDYSLEFWSIRGENTYEDINETYNFCLTKYGIR